ncbi:MAG: glycosyl transferase [Verrucomicrobiae bacterium]|nr:glycosyl transferase [Verrucomicrobiae bacterium]
MSDFYQHGLICTLHHLNNHALEKMESEMEQSNKRRPIGLLLPSLFSELERPAMQTIVEELKKVPYLSQIVISMNRMSGSQFDEARRFFDQLPQQHIIIWNDGPRIEKLYRWLKQRDLAAYIPGKGYNVWMGLGYLLAQRNIDVVAVHDCDIINYNRELLARLLYPVADPSQPYEFCKGFYSRVTDRLHGRATRLLMQPLLYAMIRVCGHLPLLDYLSNFRYVLSGEMAITTELARAIRIPGNWGLEVALLAEIHRNTTTRRVCQSDITLNYEHKHQPLSPRDAREGLHRMAVDICKSLFRTISSEGVHLSPTLFATLRTTYVRHAQDLVDRFSHDAEINNLKFDRNEELTAVETFVKAIHEAGEAFLKDPLSTSFIVNWNRVNSALEGFSQELMEAVRLDNQP